MTYDSALFHQVLSKKKKPDGTVSRADVHECFWVVCKDLELAIKESVPDKWDEADLMVMEVYVPALVADLERNGWKIEG